MPVQFTRSELAELEEANQKFAPPFPIARNIKTASLVRAISTAGLPTGLLVNARLDNGAILTLQLNPVVALHLLTKILHAGRQGTWWDDDVELIPSDGVTA